MAATRGHSPNQAPVTAASDLAGAVSRSYDFSTAGSFLAALFFFCRPGFPESGRINLLLSPFGARPTRSISFHRRCCRVGGRASWPKEEAMRPGALRTGVYGCCLRCDRINNPRTRTSLPQCQTHPNSRTRRRNGLGSLLIQGTSGETGGRQNKLILSCLVLEIKLMGPGQFSPRNFTGDCILTCRFAGSGDSSATAEAAAGGIGTSCFFDLKAFSLRQPSAPRLQDRPPRRLGCRTSAAEPVKLSPLFLAS